MCDYRKKYVNVTGRSIPLGFNIHHIDEDSRNNDIDNLVAIPMSLHFLLNMLNDRGEKSNRVNNKVKVFIKIRDEQMIEFIKFQDMGSNIDKWVRKEKYNTIK